MQVVTVAQIVLNRPGTLGFGFQRTVSGDMDPRRISVVVVDGEEPGDVLRKVKEMAAKHGEHPEELDRLGVSTPFGAAPGTICFNEHYEPFRSGVQFGQHYAECEVFPALEVEGRYFRLDEVLVLD